MSNRLFTKITGTIAPLFHSRASAPPIHAFLRSPSTSKRLLHNQHMTILKELRRHGSDRVWPRSISDEDFSATAKRIAIKASENLHLPLQTVENVLHSMMWPRMEPFIEAKEKNLGRVFDLYRDGDFTEQKDEHGHKLKRFNLDNVPYQSYSEYKGEWEFPASMVLALPRFAGFKTFQAMLRNARPKGFADGPEEMGSFTFTAMWSWDGVMWFNVKDEEEFEALYEMCLEHEEKQFTVLFLQNHWMPPQEQDWSL